MNYLRLGKANVFGLLGEGGARREEKLFAQSQQLSLWTCWGKRRKAETGSMGDNSNGSCCSCSPAAVLFINVVELRCLHTKCQTTTTTTTSSTITERTTTMPFTQCLLSIVRCPFACWLFAYFYHRFGAVAATEIIDKVFNQPLTLTQRHNVYSVCVCVGNAFTVYLALQSLNAHHNQARHVSSFPFSVRWFVRSFARIMRDA